MQASETAPAKVVVGSRPSEDLEPASALSLPPVTPCQPYSLLESLPLQTPHHWQPHLFPRRRAREKDATMTKDHTSNTPTLELVAGPEAPTTNVSDAKNAGESPAQTKASSAAPQDIMKTL